MKSITLMALFFVISHSYNSRLGAKNAKLAKPHGDYEKQVEKFYEGAKRLKESDFNKSAAIFQEIHSYLKVNPSDVGFTPKQGDSSFIIISPLESDSNLLKDYVELQLDYIKCAKLFLSETAKAPKRTLNETVGQLIKALNDRDEKKIYLLSSCSANEVEPAACSIGIPREEVSEYFLKNSENSKRMKKSFKLIGEKDGYQIISNELVTYSILFKEMFFASGYPVVETIYVGNILNQK